MRNPNYDPRSPLGHTYLRQAHWEERSRDAGVAQSVGERVIYFALVLATSILTLGATSALVRKINK